MLPLLLSIVAFMFLFVGAVAFLVCVLLPPARRYALSTALWFAMWGPCTVTLLLIVGLGLVAGGLLMNAGENPFMNAPKLVAAIGWSYLSAGVIITSIVATVTAWVHQFVIHRLTLFLFRLYSTAVVAGIGSLFGWSLGWWIIAHSEIHYGAAWWVLGMMVLIAGFGRLSYRGARSLRGKPPTAWTWISAEEFRGFTSD